MAPLGIVAIVAVALFGTGTLIKDKEPVVGTVLQGAGLGTIVGGGVGAAFGAAGATGIAATYAGTVGTAAVIGGGAGSVGVAAYDKFVGPVPLPPVRPTSAKAPAPVK